VSKNDQTPAFYVLNEDKKWARRRIAELEKAIQNLGPEFNVALNQSNETWHDNAPFDALRDTQAIMVAEMQMLKDVLFKAAISVPAGKAGRVNIGARVTVNNNGRTHVYLVAGHWSPLAGTKQAGAVVISCSSPLGNALLGAKIGATVTNPVTSKPLHIVNA
jgi:transcription elongation GreA/GreB family factor